MRYGFFFYIDLLQVRLTKVHNQVFFSHSFDTRLIFKRYENIWIREWEYFSWGVGVLIKNHHEITCTFKKKL